MSKGINERLERQDRVECVLDDHQKLTCEIGDIIGYSTCIVNAANESLLGGGGVDGAIHAEAGLGLLEECRTLHGCRTGEAKITRGYRLKADYVIHTVGPIYSVHEHPEMLLHSCYCNSLDLAAENHIHEIAFPAISTGVYGYPKQEAAEIAVRTVREWMKKHGGYELTVHFVCFGRRDFDIYQELLK